MSDESVEQEQEPASAPDQRTMERCVDTARMFKLRRGLGQLDLYHRQKEQDVQTAREQQRACRQHVEELLEQREKLEEEMECQRTADNSAVLFRLRAQHRRLCEELQREEELELQLRDALNKHQLELCEAEMELAKVSALRQVVQQEEQSFNLQKQQKATRRLQQERQTQTNRLNMAQRMNDKASSQKNNISKEVKKTSSSTNTLRFMRESMLRAQGQEADRQQENRELMESRRQAVKALQSNISAAHSRAKAPRQREQKDLKEQKEQCEEARLWAGGTRPAVMEKQQKHWNSKERYKARGLEMEATSPLKKQQLRGEKKQQTMQLKAPEGSRLLHFTPSPSPLPSTLHHTQACRELSDSEDTSDQEEQQHEEEDDRAEDLEQPEFCGLWTYDYKEKKPGLAQPEVEPKTCTTPSDKINSSAKKAPIKEKRGPSFSSKPELLHFKDFEMGQMYKKKVILTNVTYSNNSCRFVGVSSALNNCMSVSFEPPGSLSTGMCCELQVVFEPQVNEDLEGEIRFATATDPFSVPVRCSTKKCQMEVDSSCIDFGSHVVGQDVTRCITLTNHGALGCVFRLDMFDSGPAATLQEQEGQTAGNDEKRQESGVQQERQTLPAGTEAGSEQLFFDPSHSVDSPHCADSSDATCDVHFGSVTEGQIGPFQSTKLDIVFKPTIPGDTRLTFYIHFSDPSTPPIPVQVKATAVSLPVWVSHPTMDMKICLWDQNYHHSICVHSRANTALKLIFEVAPELKSHMEMVPKTGFVQAQSSFKALLKFQPRPSLPEDAGGFFDCDTGVLEAPVEVHAAGQSVPFTVSAVLTSSDLNLDPSLLDFGPCSVHQALRSSVRLSNLSLLPQDFGFCNVPEFVEVQPNDGFGTLLPQETLNIDLIFRPKKVQVYSFQICCKTGLNRDLVLSCRGLGVRPPLELSHSAVRFGATALGHCSSVLVHVDNTERPLTPAQPRLFSFHVPDQSDVSVSPSTGCLRPGERCVIQLTFRPRLHEAELREEGSDTRTEAKECPAEGSKGELVKMSERSACPPLSPAPGPHSVTCFVSDPVPEGAPEPPSWRPVNTLCLKLQCPVVQPPLVVTSDSGVNTMDFHHVTVGETVTQKCVVQNVSEESLHLGSSLLAVGGPFSVLNALRPLRPGQSHPLLVAFCPSGALKYRERLELRSLRGALWLTLCGEGVRPEVTCSPSAPELDFGRVLVNESSSHTLKLQNNSVLEVGFRTLLSSQAPPTLHRPPQLLSGGTSDRSAFCAVPAEGRLAPGQSKDVQLCFHPKEEQDFRARFTVQLSNQSEVCVMDLQGAAYSRSMFVRGGDPLSRTPLHSEEEPTPVLVTLRAPQGGQTVVRELQVGCVRSTLPNKKSAEFVWENLGSAQQQGFSVEPSRGAVEPGRSRTVSVTWTPPSGYKPHDVLQSSVTLTLKADTVRVYSVTFLALVTSDPS